MRGNISSLVVLLGIPMLGVCATALYLLYSKDDEEDLDESAYNVTTSRATVLEIKIPKANVGVVIGRGGSNIKEIEQKSDTKINFRDDEDDVSRTCVIRGSNEAVNLAEAMIHEFILNQPLIETFEMWAPQRSMGRIIGRGGESIRDISRASNAKVTVDRSTSEKDGKTRIIIKGTSEQIAVAKSLIEDKIEEDEEARTKVKLSAASRSPRNRPNKAICAATSNNNTKTKDLSPEKLVPVTSDGSLEVYVSAIISPSKFWVQVISPKTVELDHLVDHMADYYQDQVNRDLHKLTEVKLDQIVAAPFEFDAKWYRASVRKIEVDDYDQSQSQLELCYVDYGDTSYKKLSEVCQIRTDFLELRFQAIECSLARVKPSNAEWTEEAIDLFEEISHVALWRPLNVQIVSYKDSEREGSPIPCVDIIDTSGPKDIDVGSELVRKGFAVWVEKPDSISSNNSSAAKTQDSWSDKDIELNGQSNGGQQCSSVHSSYSEENS